MYLHNPSGHFDRRRCGGGGGLVDSSQPSSFRSSIVSFRSGEVKMIRFTRRSLGTERACDVAGIKFVSSLSGLKRCTNDDRCRVGFAGAIGEGAAAAAC